MLPSSVVCGPATPDEHVLFRLRTVTCLGRSRTDAGFLHRRGHPGGHVAGGVGDLSTVEGTQVGKGQQFGYFQFGGSDIVILFQPGVDVQVDTSEHYRLVGTPVARYRPLNS
jgi:hypothetical protein